MKSIKTLCVTLIINFILISSSAESFRVNVNYLVFHIPNDTSYVEVPFLFQKMIYKLNSSGLYQATVRVDLQFKNVESEQEINRQYNFLSEGVKDSLAASTNSIYNLVRIPLPLGRYQIKISTFDKNDSLAKPLARIDTISVDFDREKISISDIQPITSLVPVEKASFYSKYGYDYMPYFSEFYAESITKLTFFAEVYNIDKANPEKTFHIVTYITKTGEYMPISPNFQKKEYADKEEQNIVIQSFSIDSLPSGNYNLVLEVKDEQGGLYARSSLFFQRSNPAVTWAAIARTDSLPLDTLKLYLNYIYPIATQEEKYFIDNVKYSKYQDIEGFFQNFWYKRNKTSPHEEWFKYYKMVMQVNNNYSTLSFKGYRTDRGHYYLKYGPPNYIEFHTSEINSFSYEIWYYYTFPATGQTNVYFVFYEKDLVTRDFRLLHSNATGELQEPRWKEILKLQTDINMPDDNRLKRDSYSTDDYVY